MLLSTGVKKKKKNYKCGGIYESQDSIVRWVYAPRFFVSSQQKFGVTDIKAPLVGHRSRVLDRPL